MINNTQTIGELLPSYTRDLTFRMTVRDNQFNGGGVDYDEIAFDVTDAAGPFLVTAPNTLVVWDGNALETVTWDVANTDAAPVNAATVNILLSTDGGVTYPTALASGTPNDGTELITVPNIGTTMARVKVEAVGNIFFDISNANFTINVSGPATRYVATTGSDVGNCTNPVASCATVAYAVDQANDGDTIDIEAGNYVEPGLLIDKQVMVNGDGTVVR